MHCAEKILGFREKHFYEYTYILITKLFAERNNSSKRAILGIKIKFHDQVTVEILGDYLTSDIEFFDHSFLSKLRKLHFNSA